MILADDRSRRARRPSGSSSRYQRKDFVGIFTAMKGLPVTVRLLDPPLHEFLPHEDKRARSELAKELGVKPAKKVKDRVSINCTRPTRCSATAAAVSAITYPEILTDAGHRDRRGGDRSARRRKIDAIPGDHDPPRRHQSTELSMLRERIAEETIDAVKSPPRSTSGKLDIPIGTMIEIPRAALTADQGRRARPTSSASGRTT